MLTVFSEVFPVLAGVELGCHDPLVPVGLAGGGKVDTAS